MTNLSRTYYVSSKNGNDLKDGLTRESAFASLFAINHTRLQPGDKVLLERGSVFYGQYLQVTDSGSEDAPIVIGAYGDGAAPRSKPADRESGIRIMEIRWMRQRMYIMAMYLRQSCCMMRNISW